MSKYSIQGKEIYSERGRLVATLDENGNPVMMPGMAGAHSKGVQEFLDGSGEEENAPFSVPASAVPDAGNSLLYVGEIPATPCGIPKAKEKEETEAEWEISTIPQDSLPPFTKEQGVNTPGFAEYVKKHSLNSEQVVCLIQRLSKI